MENNELLNPSLSVAGNSQIGGVLRGDIRNHYFWSHKFWFRNFRLAQKSGGGILLYGPTGCGKTYLARAISTECEAEFNV